FDRLAFDQPVHEADALRLLGADGAPGQDQLERPRLADDARQPLGAAITGNQAELDLGEAQLRVQRGETEGGRQRELEPAAEGIAVDDRDRGDRQRVELGKDLLAALDASLLCGKIPAAKLL